MFKKRRGQEMTIIGRGARFEGALTVAGSLRIDGEMQGNVTSEATVSVGPEGRVDGTVRAADVEIAGLVEGTVTTSGCLHMFATGRINGDAYYHTMQVDCGGVIDGRTRCVVATDDALPEPAEEEDAEEEDAEEEDADDDEALSLDEEAPADEDDSDDESPTGAFLGSSRPPAEVAEGDQSVELLHTGEFTELQDIAGESGASGKIVL